VNWETHQIGIPGATAKDKENRRIPFNPHGRLATILKRRATLGPEAYVFGSTHGAYQPTLQTGWETLKLMANGLELKAGAQGIKENQEALRRIDLRWHDLRHEGACRLLADAVDIRIIQLMLGHASIQQTQRYLNLTDEELRRGLEVSWGRQLRAVSDGEKARSSDDLSQICPTEVEELAKSGPRAGLEPATLRLTEGKRPFCRPLRRHAQRRRIVTGTRSSTGPIGDQRGAAVSRPNPRLDVSKGQEKGNVKSG
jgi:hypothetical protein